MTGKQSSFDMKENEKQNGLVVNIDINSVVFPFLNHVVQNKSVTEKDLYPFIDQYAGTQITDVALNVFCQYSNTPSVVFTDAYNKYEQKQENGLPVDYTSYYESIYSLTILKKMDVYDIWFRRCRQQGLRAWLSIRMNDAHCPNDQTSFLRSDFCYAARERGWIIGPSYGYYRYCLDYAQEVVRHMMLAYIAEQLDRYDVDGLELDFLREIYCFDYKHNQNATSIMNEFMRDVRKIVHQAEQKWGHRILIMCRLMRDIDQNLAFGFDVASWIFENLVDIVAVGPRWASCDSDIPIEKWKELCGDKIPVYACLEILVCRQSSMAYATADVARGFAAQYFQAGADKIYLYNYFQNPFQPSDQFEAIYKTCGDLATIMKYPRRHIVTFQDLCPDGFIPYKPLPVEIGSNEGMSLIVRSGPVYSDELTWLVVGILRDATPESVYVFVNDTNCPVVRPTTIESYDGEHDLLTTNGYVSEETQLYLYSISSPVNSGKQKIYIENLSDNPIRITYLEFFVCR